eukprot:TRINITY_DN10849_c0_g1_i1.p1 TRINITY_DN10849_c0_g1~~TRINITY_DN10849_c0_g1_i1.p1  ORF type:complete len:861 (+),score=328.81 TRINITY_DN10849_c0_g1_i1:60-2642(+)
MDGVALVGSERRRSGRAASGSAGPSPSPTVWLPPSSHSSEARADRPVWSWEDPEWLSDRRQPEAAAGRRGDERWLAPASPDFAALAEASRSAVLTELPHSASREQLEAACAAYGRLCGPVTLLPTQRPMRADGTRQPPLRSAIVRFTDPAAAQLLRTAGLRIGCRRVPAAALSPLLVGCHALATLAAQTRAAEALVRRPQLGDAAVVAAVAVICAVQVPLGEAAMVAAIAAKVAELAELVLRAYDEDGDGVLSKREFGALCEDTGLDSDHFESICARNGGEKDAGGRWTGLTLAGLRRLEGVVTLAAGAAAGRVAAAAVRAAGTASCKGKAEAAVLGSRCTFDVSGVAERLRQLWQEKKGDVVDELVANLHSPAALESVKLTVLRDGARALQQRAGVKYPGRGLAELLVMALYTMAGQDIDLVMGFTGRQPDAAPANAALFSTVNRAMRDAAEEPTAAPTQGRRSWATVQKWVKTISLLLALSTDSSPPPPKQQPRSRSSSPPSSPLASEPSAPSLVPVTSVLYRGLAGLPPDVLRIYASLRPGDEVQWASPSSCATDAGVSVDYINGAAVNATKSQAHSGTVFFTVEDAAAGLPLAGVSKYPKEAEVLLPALSSFSVVRCNTGGPGLPPDCACVDLKWQAPQVPLSAFVASVLADAKAASRKLAAAMRRGYRPIVPVVQAPEVPRKELLQLVHKAMCAEYGSVRSAYSRMDIDRSKLVTFQEVQEGMSRAGVGGYAVQLYGVLGAGGAGGVTQQMWLQLLNTVPRKRAATRKQDTSASKSPSPRQSPGTPASPVSERRKAERAFRKPQPPDSPVASAADSVASFGSQDTRRSLQTTFGRQPGAASSLSTTFGLLPGSRP